MHLCWLFQPKYKQEVMAIPSTFHLHGRGFYSRLKTVVVGPCEKASMNLHNQIQNNKFN